MTTEGASITIYVGNYSAESSRLRIQFLRGEVAGSPEVPAGDRAPGLPFFCAAMHFVGFGEIGWGHLVGGFQFAKGEGKAFADTVVVDGEDVGPAEAEDEKHLDCPAADATNLCQVLDDCFVGHAADAREGGDRAVDGLCGEVAEGEGLVVREARSAELFVGAVEEMLRVRVLLAADGVEAFDQTAVDHSGSFAVELLVDDAFDQGFERRLSTRYAHGERARALDELTQFGIGRR